jgi:hypothetical protein
VRSNNQLLWRDIYSLLFECIWDPQCFDIHLKRENSVLIFWICVLVSN